MQGESFAFFRIEGTNPRESAVFLNIQGWKHLEAIVCPPYKLTYDPDTAVTRLVDLEADPRELVDLVAQRPEHARRLREVLLAQLEAQDAYHADEASGRALRSERFAPRMLACPELPAAERLVARGP
jgi:hypothetical protein